jgi:hypothetical protein
MIELRRVKADAFVPLSEVAAANGRLPSGWSEQTEPVGRNIDLDLVRQLSEKAAKFLDPEEMDPWLAPRLHCALRIPRRVASDDGVWAWLALQSITFIEARFRKGGKPVHPWRYRGVWSRNGLSRLWWGAEMTRNGPDYSAVPLCFNRTRTAQFALELMYSWDRAAAIAFARVAEGADGGDRLSDDQTNRLSTRLKVLLSLRSLEAVGLQSEADTEEFDSDWGRHSPTFSALSQADVGALRGPATGCVAGSRVSDLERWFRQIVSDSGVEAA